MPDPNVDTLRVVLESPYAGDVEGNIQYARECLRDCLRRGEAPITSHLLLTQVLNDLVPLERQAGIVAGLAWHDVADLVVFYTDKGWSRGMKYAWEYATALGRKTEIRSLYGQPLAFPGNDNPMSVFTLLGRE